MTKTSAINVNVPTDVKEEANVLFNLSVARETLAAAAAGNYILAMGGSASSGRVNTVDIFQFGCQHNNLCKSNNKNKL